MTSADIVSLLEKWKAEKENINQEVVQELLKTTDGDVDQLIYSLCMHLSGYDNRQKELKDTMRNEMVKLFNEKDTLNKKIQQLEDEKKQLRLQMIDLRYHNGLLEKTLGQMNKGTVQKELMKAGKKIAYKDNASLDRVYELHQRGYSKKKIAEVLGVSLGTIYNRYETLRNSGLI